MWVFDILIRNCDRHGGNILCSENYGGPLLHAIDNGCSFGADAPHCLANFFDEDLPAELIVKIESFLENKQSQKILRNLFLELLSEAEVDAFFRRVRKIGEMISENKKILKS